MEEREERCVSLHNLIVMFRFIQQTFGIQGHNGRKMLEISRVILTILPRLHGIFCVTIAKHQKLNLAD
jgi:hypothetical protein